MKSKRAARRNSPYTKKIGSALSFHFAVKRNSIAVRDCAPPNRLDQPGGSLDWYVSSRTELALGRRRCQRFGLESGCVIDVLLGIHAQDTTANFRRAVPSRGDVSAFVRRHDPARRSAIRSL
jgi:hypothetical protein